MFIIMKNVLITGASRGLGYVLAEEYAKNGFFVIACARGGASGNLKRLQDKYKGSVGVVAMDVADKKSVEHAAGQVKDLVTGIDILINNAAIHSADSGAVLEKADIESCLEVYNVNTLGALRVSQAFIGLIEKGGMKILVNISSEAGSISGCKRENEFDYAMSKAALNMQSKLLQNYLRSKDIKVLAVHPGWMRTDMGGKNAKYSPEEAAGFVVKVIEKYGRDIDGPVYVNFDGGVLEF
jgi:NAD(P)-dependent dehydrogenase (short-subunit alcohol dehydrogenase family)